MARIAGPPASVLPAAENRLCDEFLAAAAIPDERTAG